MQDKQGKGRLPAQNPRVLVAPCYKRRAWFNAVRKMVTQPERVDRIRLTEPERHSPPLAQIPLGQRAEKRLLISESAKGSSVGLPPGVQ